MTGNLRRSRPPPLTSPAGTVVQLFDRALRIADARVPRYLDPDVVRGKSRSAMGPHASSQKVAAAEVLGSRFSDSLTS